MFNGKMRKLALTATRNGYYFTMDRVTGEHLVTSKYGKLTNWATGLNKFGGPKLDPGKDATVGGSLVSPNSDGTINWEPPAYSPEPGCYMSPSTTASPMFYLTDLDPRGSMGLGGKEEAEVGSGGTYLTAIDYKTGKIAWRHPYYSDGGGGGGLLATAGGLIFARRRCGKSGGARRGDRQAAVEHAHRRRHQCAADLHAGWPSIRDRGYGRYALVLRDVLGMKLSMRGNCSCFSGMRRYRYFPGVASPRGFEPLLSP